MEILFMLLLAFLGMLFLVLLLYKKIHVVELIVFSIIGLASVYVLASGMLFWVDAFSVTRGIVACLLVEAVGVISLLKRFKSLKIEFDLKDYRFVFAMAIVALLLSFGKNELFGMGQDEGVYQTKAIELMHGNTDNQIDFEEYTKLTSEEDKQEYLEFLPRFIGYYTSAEFPTFQPEDKISDASGYYHGIPTFAALMALFGSCFGVSNMTQFQTVFYICTLFLLFFSCRNLKLSKSTTKVLLALFTFSPIVIWVSKSALTEPFLGVLLAWFLYLATDEKNLSTHMAFLPILVLSIYHISCYTLMPLFYCILVAKYLYTGKTVFLRQCALGIVGFLWGFTVSCFIAPQYSFDNCVPMMFGPVNYDTLLFFVWGASICLALILFLFRVDIVHDALLPFLQSSFFAWMLRVFTAATLILIAYKGYRCGWHMTGSGVTAYYGTGADVFQYLTLTAEILCTGLIVMPITIVKTLVKPDICLKDDKKLVSMIAFFYLCLVLCAFLRPFTHHYYYYCRYTAPFVVPLLLYCGIMLDGFENKSIIYAVGIISVSVLLPFDMVLATGKDDTRMQWSAFEELANCFTDRDALLVEEVRDGRAEKTAVLAIRAATGVDIYPRGGELSDTLIDVLGEYDNVYYLDEGSKYTEIPSVCSIEYTVSEDVFQKREWLLPLPSGFSYSERNIQVRKIEPEVFDYEPMSVWHSTRNGILDAGTITSDGRQDWLLYGPYCTLCPGTYALEIKGKLLAGETNADCFFDITCANGKDELFPKTNLQEFFDEGEFNLCVSFDVDERLDDCEFRVFVNEGLILRIDSSTLRKSK